MNVKEKLLVVCPGRGTYTKKELGYLKPHRPAVDSYLKTVNDFKKNLGEPTVSELDNADKFSLRTHTVGENASLLIYSCSFADFSAINRDKYEIVAITGNSMGWYSAMAMADSLEGAHGLELINTMGSMMKDGVIGGQTIYPVTDENWVIQQDKLDLVLNAIKEANLDPDCQAHVSIFFGGYVVIGSNEKGQRWLLKNLPAIEDKYPLKLPNHAAFHTPLLKDTSEEAFSVVSQRLFSSPRIPMIDGRGKIWQPFSTDTKELRDYTLGEQVYDTYHFTKAVQVGLKEFAPDRVCVLGPGSSLGGAVGQIMIDAGWHGLKSKEDFMARQESDPLVLAAGREDQRKILQGK